MRLTVITAATTSILISLSSCSGCSGKKENRSGSEEPTEETGPGTIDLPDEEDPTELYGLDDTLPVAGYATEDVNGVDLATAGTIAVTTDGASLTAGDACQEGTFTAKLVGSGYELAKDVAYSGFKFELAKAPKKHEIVIELSCGMRCLVQAGQRGVLCNKVADRVFAAFEGALGKTLYDKTFFGVKTAKIAASIVDAAQLNGDDTAEFKKNIVTCDEATDATAKQTCYRDAIKVSPFEPAFKIMQQLSMGWTPEGLYNYVTTVLGVAVEVDEELYSPIMDGLEKALGNDFITQTRALLADAVKAQRASETKYPFQVSCILDINGVYTAFMPDVDADDKLACDQTQCVQLLTAAGIDPQYHDEILSNRLHEPVPCTHEQANPDGECWASLRMQIASSAQEQDRNDYDGSRRERNERSFNMVEVMPQVMIALMDAGIDVGHDGPPTVSPSQMNTLVETLKDQKDYFLGMVGMYRFLNDPAVRGLKLSLNDLHEVFVDSEFMNTRLVGWGPGLSGVQFPRPDGNGQSYVAPLLKPDASGDFLTLDDIFVYDPVQGYTQKTVTAAQAFAYIDDAELPFDWTMRRFTRVPTTRETERFVFDSSRHEEWNPAGSQYLHVAQLGSTGKPIACKGAGFGANFSLVSGTTIECDAAAMNVTCGSGETEGACTFPSDYEYGFLLQERGWFGDTQGRLFSLISRTTGRPVGGREGIIVRETKAANSVGECKSGEEGQIVQYIARFDCGPDRKCEQNVTAYCLDMSAFGTPARRRFYPGGFHTVSFFNEMTGETNKWDAPRVGVHDTTLADHLHDTSACLFVPTTTFNSDRSNKADVALATVDADGDIDLTSVGTAAINDCSNSTGASEAKFVLYQYRDFAGADTMFAYLMNDKNETMMWTYDPTAPGMWDSNYARISETEMLRILGVNKAVAGAATTQINGMRFVNPAHDPKFDPYCDDTNGNGQCDCYPLETLSADGQTATFGASLRTDPKECGLRDKAAEPTLSQLPFCPTCPGSEKSAEFFEVFGGKSGAELAAADTFFPMGQFPMFDIQSSTACKFRFQGESKNRSPRWVNMSAWEGNHEGCPATDGVAYNSGAQGPIRVINPKPMRNAYLIGRPRQLLQLVNYAFKSVGQGITLDPNAKVFGLDEAMTLLRLRYQFPPDDLKVKKGGNDLVGITALFEHVENADDHTGPLSAAMKGMLLKAGKFTEADLAVEMPDGP